MTLKPAELWLATLCALGLVSGCSGSGSNASGGNGTGSGGSTNGSTTGGQIALNPKEMLQLDAGGLGAFGPIALAAAAGEGELFFSQAKDAGSTYVLQHLSPLGAAVGAGIEVASGTPFGIPNVAVSSNGKEIACCWEDWGRLDPQSPTAASVTRCNSVPVTGRATDAAMDGGFGDVGSYPALAQGTSTTALIYFQNDDAWISETILYDGSRIEATFVAPYLVAGAKIVPQGDGFTLFVSDGGATELSQQESHLENDGGLDPVPDGAGTGSFAVATNAIPALPAVTAVLLHQGSNVVVTLLGLANGSAIALRSASERPLDPLAAVGCNATTFGFAYALDGGDVALREMSTQGVITGTGTIVGPVGGNVTSVALAAVDGGMLIASGNENDIAVYAASCP